MAEDKYNPLNIKTRIPGEAAVAIFDSVSSGFLSITPSGSPSGVPSGAITEINSKKSLDKISEAAKSLNDILDKLGAGLPVEFSNGGLKVTIVDGIVTAISGAFDDKSDYLPGSQVTGFVSVVAGVDVSGFVRAILTDASGRIICAPSGFCCSEVSGNPNSTGLLVSPNVGPGQAIQLTSAVSENGGKFDRLTVSSLAPIKVILRKVGVNNIVSWIEAVIYAERGRTGEYVSNGAFKLLIGEKWEVSVINVSDILGPQITADVYATFQWQDN